MQEAVQASAAQVNEFTVAPQITPEGDELPYHEWLIEFSEKPADMETFRQALDQSLQRQNSYYLDLIEGKVLQQLKVSQIREGGFRDYMKSIGKLGGQNKVQRLYNDRSAVDDILRFKAEN